MYRLSNVIQRIETIQKIEYKIERVIIELFETEQVTNALWKILINKIIYS